MLESIHGHFLRLQEAAWVNIIVHTFFTGYFILNPRNSQLPTLQGINLHYSRLLCHPVLF